MNKNGDSIPFNLNWAQSEVLDGLHNRNIVLKARQLGMSTFAVLYMLDRCLFERNITAGIVSYSLEHARHIFRKIIGFALQNLTPKMKSLISITGHSAREVSFGNGSTLRVDTTLRGGSYQLILVSEFGKICARAPLKAEEIVTGTLNTAPLDSTIIIESTGEGTEGYFYDMCKSAELNDGDLSPLDYKFFFFPWHREPTYALDHQIGWDVSLTDYFTSLNKQGIELSTQQKYWYATQFKTLGEKIKQEFPSTPEESFVSTSEAYYFAEALHLAEKDQRILERSVYDPLFPVYVSMDLGLNDQTAIIFFQVAHGEVRVIDFYEDKNKDAQFYARFLQQDKRYTYHTIYLPHDAAKRDPLDVTLTYDRMMERFFKGTDVKIMVLPRVDRSLSISHAKSLISRCVFSSNRTRPLLNHLMKYRKKWSEQSGRYLDEPLHDIHSDSADAFRYLCQAVQLIERSGGNKGAVDKHRRAVDARRKII